MKTMLAPPLLAALLAGPALAAPTATAFPPTPLSLAGQLDDVERLEAWPELEKDQKAQVKLDVDRLRKARTPEMGEQAFDGLVATGAAAAPALLTALGKEKKEDVRARILDVLETITGAAHTRLLAGHFGEKSEHVRRFCLRRAAHFPDEGTRAQAEAAFEKATKPGKRKKADPEEVYVAALALTAAGGQAGLDALFQRAREEWADEGDVIHRATVAIRGAEATNALLPHLESEDRDDLLATLRLLAACGTKEDAARPCGVFLDNNDNGLRIAAINALRGIIDGDPPLAKLSAFDAIEMAQKWKRRIP